jgi:large subunit ribosomal protein L25
MEKLELAAGKRSSRGRAAKGLRGKGLVPAVIYGRGVRSEPLEVESKLLERVYAKAGGNKIVSLKVGDGRARNVLIYDVQRGPVKGELRHADFYVVRMDELLKAEVPLVFTGESTAVYQDEGTLLKNLEAVEVECLPADLPESIEVDISGLTDFEKSITLEDLNLPAGVKLVEENLATLVARVEPPRTDAELAELEEQVDEAAELPEDVKEEEPPVIKEENEGDMDKGRDKK